MKIDWKDPSKALTKLHPREEGDDIPAEPGSFFNFFEIEADPFDVRFFWSEFFLPHGC
jgi:template-activating factor I